MTVVVSGTPRVQNYAPKKTTGKMLGKPLLITKIYTAHFGV
jgi:hypothetical protein